jgi:predicted kinase
MYLTGFKSKLARLFHERLPAVRLKPDTTYSSLSRCNPL